jgi:hypothetical protein
MQLPITDDAIPIPPETDFELAIVDLEKGAGVSIMNGSQS